MKRASLPVPVVLLCLACGCSGTLKEKASGSASGESAGGGGGPAAALTPQETLAQQAVKLFNRATELMTSIHDRASATKVAPELKSIARQLLDLNRRGVPLGSQIQEKPQALGRFRADLEKAIRRYADVAVRLLDQENNLGPEFREALREFGKLPS
jgi:hypothetical protein